VSEGVREFSTSRLSLTYILLSVLLCDLVAADFLCALCVYNISVMLCCCF
jgi:hypothetical protein